MNVGVGRRELWAIRFPSRGPFGAAGETRRKESIPELDSIVVAESIIVSCEGPQLRFECYYE
jgi:hypothetical protein